MASASDRFAKLSFQAFRQLASDGSLSKYEKIGFPDSYREGNEDRIFSDIRSKLTNLDKTQQRVLDIGPGCSDLPKMLIELVAQRKHALTLVDSEEMLAQLPAPAEVEKIAGCYPECPELFAPSSKQFDAILCYSVLHYIILDVAFFRFLDRSLSLLAPGGQFLIGDIPNVSKRKRFFASETGARFHREFMKVSEDPEVDFNIIEHDQIDDAIVMCLVDRARAQGFDAYVLPQDPVLPMANRREDILIVRP